MNVDNALIEKLETLSRLRLNPEEKETLVHDLEQLIGMFDKIASVNTDGVEPLTHMTQEVDRTRFDEAKPFSQTENLIDQAPKSHGSYFAVPKVIE